MSSKSKEIKALELISPWKFHRIFTIPASENKGPLKVTYSIAGVDIGDGGEDVPTILFCSGMFGSRWLAPWLDYIAGKKGVRMIFLDRPGFGGSPSVNIHDRLSVFVEAVPLLLAHLKIKHVALACQSAGTIYAFNLLAHHPEILYPAHPSITFFSPWVHQSHSSVSFLTLASMLPNAVLDHWNKVMHFATRAQPTFAVSGGAFTLVTSAFKNKAASEKQKEEEAKKCLAGYGFAKDVKGEVDKALFKYAFAENSEGLNDEARLCLRSVSGVSWGACEDYEECVRNLAATWDKRVEEGGEPLRVDIHLPEEDIMVGVKGMKYFEECWREENRGKGMKVEISRWEGTDHDTTVSASSEAVAKMLSTVKGLQTADSRTG